MPNAENRDIRLVGQPVTLSRTPSKMAARPPEFGEQTEEVLAEFGFSANEIAGLRQAEVVAGSVAELTLGAIVERQRRRERRQRPHREPSKPRPAALGSRRGRRRRTAETAE